MIYVYTPHMWICYRNLTWPSADLCKVGKSKNRLESTYTSWTHWNPLLLTFVQRYSTETRALCHKCRQILSSEVWEVIKVCGGCWSSYMPSYCPHQGCDTIDQQHHVSWRWLVLSCALLIPQRNLSTQNPKQKHKGKQMLGNKVQPS